MTHIRTLYIYACNRCIPYRITEDDEDHNGDIENRIQVLMVSSPDRDDRVFPKVRVL